MSKMTFIKSGIFTSLQDMGRYGFRRYGVPVSGAMDRQSAQLANLLVNNAPDLPVLEITQSGPQIGFSEDVQTAITGADLSPHLDGSELMMNAAFQIKGGQVLSFSKPKYGVRAYLAVKGGFSSEKILTSHAQYFPVTPAGRIAKGFELTYQSHFGPVPNTAVKQDPDHFNNGQLEVTPGPEYDMLESQIKKIITEETFTIGENNRMGYQLLHEKMPANDYSIITAPVIPGTVQLTPSGKLMVLMRDAQVTGGYPRVLQLTEPAINRLAQKNTGQTASFKIISPNGNIK